MIQVRPIKPEEVVLIQAFLTYRGLNINDFDYTNEVDEYEGGIMGSICIGQPNAQYAGDIAQAKYIDTDGVEVVISLTKDTEGRLLDFDFWKADFSKLLQYPKPSQLHFLP